MTGRLATERIAAVSRQGGPGPLVVVHGFTQTRRSWDPIVKRLATRCEIVLVDAPGHGESASAGLDLPAAAADLADSVGAGTYVGYSMGGRLALHVAVGHPEVVERLVLVSSTPGIADADERAARRRHDEALAAEIERDGVDAFLERWLALDLFAGLADADAGLEERRSNTAAGLASSLRLAGTGAQQSLWERLGGLTMPVLIVAGALDRKFADIAGRMAARIPRAELVVVEGAGHVVHLERPDVFTEALAHWLDSTAG